MLDWIINDRRKFSQGKMHNVVFVNKSQSPSDTQGCRGKTYRLNVIRQENKLLVCRHLEFSHGEVLRGKKGQTKKSSTINLLSLNVEDQI